MRYACLSICATCCFFAPLAAAVAHADDRPAAADADAAEARQPRERRFVLRYTAEVGGLPAGKPVRVWIPVPKSDDFQTVEPRERKLPAAAKHVEETNSADNRTLYFDAAAPPDGKLTVELDYRAARREVRGGEAKPAAIEPANLSADAKREHLAPDTRVPLEGKPLALLAGRELPKEPLELARVLYDRVDEHVRYDKSQPGYGRGDVLWVCDSRFGNCTDFHSLFMSLARSQGLPARFEIGFPLPPERGRGPISGYHCWAYFHIDGAGWTPVDISEADKHPELRDYYFGNLDENRVTFTRGRDLELSPRQAGPPLNFLIYPYVEVDGQPWPAEKVKTALAYEDE